MNRDRGGHVGGMGGGTGMQEANLKALLAAWFWSTFLAASYQASGIESEGLP